jgi:PAS domain S-box-containing protein
MIAVLLPSGFFGMPPKLPVLASVLPEPEAQGVDVQAQDASLSKSRFLKRPVEEYVVLLRTVPGMLPLRSGIRAGRPKQLAYIPEGRISADFLLVDTEGFPWKPYEWLILAGIFVFLVQGALFLRLRNEARRRKIADRAARRLGEFERLLSQTASRLAESGPESTVAEIKRGLSQVRAHFAVDTLSMFSRTEDGKGLRGLISSADGVVDSLDAPVRFDDCPWLRGRLEGGKAVLIDRVDHLPQEAVAVKDALLKRKIQSTAIVPITTDHSAGTFVMLAVNDRQRGWPKELAGQVQILGDVLHQAHRAQKAETRTREIERRFVQAADIAPVMIWMSGRDKMCTYFNQRWLQFTGRTLEQELGNGWLEGVHSADAERCLTEYSEAFNARRKFSLEYRLRRFDGEYRWVVDHGVPRYQPEGAFCGYIGSCMDITELKRSEAELKELSGQLIRAQEDERRRIARELHDDFSQQLTLLGLEMAKLSVGSGQEPRVESMLRAVEARIRELSRAMNNRAHQLHPSYLETLGLTTAIQGFCRDFSKQHEIKVDFNPDKILSTDVPANVSLCLFRIVQEGLQNVAKHSRTRACKVELTTEQGQIVLRITDSGVGFDPASPRHKNGLGLISMRERLRLVNGRIRLVSSPKHGTRLEVKVPIKPEHSV